MGGDCHSYGVEQWEGIVIAMWWSSGRGLYNSYEAVEGDCQKRWGWGVGALSCTIDKIKFQNGLEMEKHPHCSVETLMHANVLQECLRHTAKFCLNSQCVVQENYT